MTEERAKYGDEREEPAVSTEEVLKTVVYVQEAIINILEQKGIATRDEIMAEVKRLAAENARPQH